MQGKLEAKRRDIDRLQDREKALIASFQASLGENNKFADFLMKVFKKKIKRAKKKVLKGKKENAMCFAARQFNIYFLSGLALTISFKGSGHSHVP